jgi:AAHS family 4-hydroxybenzoate transporter-like MFS transporter
LKSVSRADDAIALRTTLLCGLVVLLEGYDLSALGYVVPQLVGAWHTPPVAFTAALTASNLGMFAGAVVCGRLGDRYGRKPVLLGCIAAFGTASLLTAFVTGTSQLALARLATGVGLGGGIPVCIALVSDVSPPHRQGTLVITMITGVVVGNLAAGIVAAQMISSFGWESVFIVGGLAPLLLLPFAAIFLRESSEFRATRSAAAAAAAAAAEGTATASTGSRAALFAPGIAGPTTLLWAINFLNLLTIFFVNSWLPLLLRNMGATPQGAILATSMFYAGAIAAAFFSAALIGRYGIERVLTVMLLFAGVCIIVSGVATLSVVSLSLFILGFGFGTGGSQLGISALPGAIYPTAIRSTGAGWATGIGRLGNVAGALLGGALLGLGWSPQQMLLALGAAPLMTSVLMWALGRLRASRPVRIQAVPLSTEA